MHLQYELAQVHVAMVVVRVGTVVVEEVGSTFDSYIYTVSWLGKERGGLGRESLNQAHTSPAGVVTLPT